MGSSGWKNICEASVLLRKEITKPGNNIRCDS